MELSRIKLALKKQKQGLPAELIAHLSENYRGFASYMPIEMHTNQWEAFCNVFRFTFNQTLSITHGSENEAANDAIGIAVTMLSKSNKNWSQLQNQLENELKTKLCEYELPILRHFMKDFVELTVSKYSGTDVLTAPMIAPVAKVMLENRTPLAAIKMANHWLDKRRAIMDRYDISVEPRWTKLIDNIQVPMDADAKFAAARGFKIVSLADKIDMQDEGRIMHTCSGHPLRIAAMKSGREHRLSIRDTNGQRLATLPLELKKGHSDLTYSMNIPDGRYLEAREIVTYKHANDHNPPADVLEALEWLKQKIETGVIPIIWTVKVDPGMTIAECRKKSDVALKMFAEANELKIGVHHALPEIYQGMSIDKFLSLSGLREKMCQSLKKLGYDNLAQLVQRGQENSGNKKGR